MDVLHKQVKTKMIILELLYYSESFYSGMRQIRLLHITYKK